MTFNAKKGTNIYNFFRVFGEKTRRKLPVVTQKERKCRKWLGTKTLNDAPGGGGGQVWVGRRCVFGQGCRKRRKTAKVTENEAILGVRTDHHHSSHTRPTTTTNPHTHIHTQTVVRGSPAVRVDHNNTPEKGSRGESAGAPGGVMWYQEGKREETRERWERKVVIRACGRSREESLKKIPQWDVCRCCGFVSGSVNSTHVRNYASVDSKRSLIHTNTPATHTLCRGQK